MLGLTAALSVILVAFAWPTSQLKPRHLPIAVVGPAGAADQLAAVLARAAGADAFDVKALGSRDAAVAAIENREVYGAVVAAPTSAQMLVCSAASPIVAQMLTQVGSQLAAPSGAPPAVTDVVPLPEDDPRGAIFAAGAFPLVIGGIAVGVALALRVPGRARRLLAGVGVAGTSGLARAAVQQYWFGALGGSYRANAGVYALAVSAMAAAVVGLHNLLGLPGLVLAAATILLLGNPLSAITSAPELLPDGWSLLGQLLPPGAGGTALRSTAFFHGVGVVAPLLMLAVWLLVGAGLAALPLHRSAMQPPPGYAHRPTARPLTRHRLCDRLRAADSVEWGALQPAAVALLAGPPISSGGQACATVGPNAGAGRGHAHPAPRWR